MPKRLLRYALSRLDLLDSEALDLDNLDLALGRNTVLEFRDVAIKLPVRSDFPRSEAAEARSMATLIDLVVHRNWRNSCSSLPPSSYDEQKSSS